MWSWAACSLRAVGWKPMTYRLSKDTAVLILNVGFRRRWVVKFTPWPLHVQKSTSVSIEQETGWVGITQPVW